MASCPSCGAGAPDGARFCENCGSKIPSGCLTCGEPLAPGAAFCGNCGTRTGAPTPPAAAPPPAPVVQPPPVAPVQHQAPPPQQFQQPPAAPPQFQRPPAAQPMAPPAQAPPAYQAPPVAAVAPPAQQINVNVGTGAPGAMPGAMQRGQPGGWKIPTGYIFAVLGGIIGIALGAHLWRTKIPGPQGIKVPRYDESAQFHGKIIFAIACVMSVIWIALNAAA